MAVVVTRPVLALLSIGFGAAAGAAGIADPTEPPPGYRVPQHPAGAQAADALAAPEPVKLQMIARDGSARLAVVNGHRVRTGETLTLDGKPAKVVAIRDDAVVLDRDGHRQTVQLFLHRGLK
jgi:hypothetical protein